MITDQSTYNIISHDLNAYRQLISNKGGFIPDQAFQEIKEFVTRAYSKFGRFDFFLCKKFYNVGHGTKMYSFHGKEVTIVNGSWESDGLHLTNGNSYAHGTLDNLGNRLTVGAAVTQSPTQTRDYVQLVYVGREQWDWGMLGIQGIGPNYGNTLMAQTRKSNGVTYDTAAVPVPKANYAFTSVTSFDELKFNYNDFSTSRPTYSQDTTVYPLLGIGAAWSAGVPNNHIDGIIHFVFISDKKINHQDIREIYEDTIGDITPLDSLTVQALVDTAAYHRQLRSQGRTLDGNSLNKLFNFSKGLYSLCGRPVDFYAMKPAFNMGSGSKLYSFRDELPTLTLVNGVLWTENGPKGVNTGDWLSYPQGSVDVDYNDEWIALVFSNFKNSNTRLWHTGGGGNWPLYPFISVNNGYEADPSRVDYNLTWSDSGGVAWGTKLHTSLDRNTPHLFHLSMVPGGDGCGGIDGEIVVTNTNGKSIHDFNYLPDNRWDLPLGDEGYTSFGTIINEGNTDPQFFADIYNLYITTIGS